MILNGRKGCILKELSEKGYQIQNVDRIVYGKFCSPFIQASVLN